MLTVQDLSTLDPASVQQKQEFLAEMAQELNPAIDTKRGVLHDLVLYLSSLFGQADDQNLDNLRRSSSLLEVSTDPTFTLLPYDWDSFGLPMTPTLVDTRSPDFNIGLDLKLLTRELFTMLVIMALLTTAMCGPLLRLWLPKELKHLLPRH